METVTPAQDEGISTMKFESCSQAAQDRFAYEISGRMTDGTFLDIGSYNVICCNNSYALERIGWRGLMVDKFRDEENLPKRTSPFLQADATKIDWLTELDKAGLPRTIDYLSVDVDEATMETVMSLPLASSNLKFNVATIEHDAYRFGNVWRDEIRRRMSAQGYDLVCADVLMDGKPFEDWFVNRLRLWNISPYRCQGLEWTEIIKRIV